MQSSKNIAHKISRALCIHLRTARKLTPAFARTHVHVARRYLTSQLFSYSYICWSNLRYT